MWALIQLVLLVVDLFAWFVRFFERLERRDKLREYQAVRRSGQPLPPGSSRT